MKILNLYFATGNTEKVAHLITETVQQLGDTIEVLLK